MSKRIDVTRNFYRVRIRSPKSCDRSSFRVKTLSKQKGIKATVCCLKGKFSRGRCRVGTVVQSVLFSRKKFTKAQVKRRAKKFKK